MPHIVLTAPGSTRSMSLGRLAVWFMETFTVHGRGGAAGMKVVHTEESEGFIYDCYAVDQNGKRMHNSAFYSRPKGCDKSGIASRIALFEGLGPARFIGWAKGGETYEFQGVTFTYMAGEAMGARITNPLIRIMATEEEQAGNTYDSIYYNLTAEDAPLSQQRAYGMIANKDKILLPGGGEIIPSTSSGASKDGGLETFVVFDESHLYNNQRLKSMHAVVTNNLEKRKAEGSWYLETTTMFATGEDSIAEQTYDYMELSRNGKTKNAKMLFDHRYSSITDEQMLDEELLRAALLESYGSAAISLDSMGKPQGWISIEGLIESIHDPRNAENKNPRRFFFNDKSAISGRSWLQPQQYEPVVRKGIVLAPKEKITLGFDGAVTRDGTALMGCRVSDGYIFKIRCDEQPDGPEAKGWRVSPEEFDGIIAQTFEKYDVVGFFADPAYWETWTDKWTREYGGNLKSSATSRDIIKFYTTTISQMVRALDRLHTAILNGEATITDDVQVKRHFMNAVTRDRGPGEIIEKMTHNSPRKIDIAMAATLAFEARARYLNVDKPTKTNYVPMRV